MLKLIKTINLRLDELFRGIGRTRVKLIRDKHSNVAIILERIDNEFNKLRDGTYKPKVEIIEDSHTHASIKITKCPPTTDQE